MYAKIKKRSGSVVKFRPEKITSAIERAGLASEEFGETEARQLTETVLKNAEKTKNVVK